MLQQRIEQHFIDSADLKYQSAQLLAKPVEQAVQALLACVTGGGKVLACGHDGSAALAQHFAALFVGRFERERPELGALALTANGAILTATTQGDDGGAFARQVRALGQTGDVLVALSAQGQPASIQRAMEAAQQRDMTVIALTGQPDGDIGTALRETDVHISVPHSRVARIHEAVSYTHLTLPTKRMCRSRWSPYH